MVYFNRNDPARYNLLVENIDKEVRKYESNNETSVEKGQNSWTKVCSFSNPVDDTHACYVNTQRFGTYCYRNMDYGYPDGQPCFLIKVNKVHGWTPEPYETFQELMEAGFPLPWEESDFDPNYLPVSCQGEVNKKSMLKN